MKKLLLFLVLLLGISGFAVPNPASAPLKSRVDECFELTSIVFRIVGAGGYTLCGVPKYAKDIDSTFAPYRDLQLIHYIKELREKNKQNALSYDAVSSAAACLEIKNEKIVLKPGIDVSKISEMDSRWTPETFKTFVKYLNDFYKQSRFRDFYTNHADLYRMAEQRLDEYVSVIDVSWFESIFGEKLENPLVIVSLTNGPSNFAFVVPDKNKQFGIVVGTGSDGNGLPAFGSDFSLIILHEFFHKYANPRINDNWAQIDSAAQKIYSHIHEDMRKTAYGSAKATMREWFGNLMVILYCQDYPKQTGIPVNYLIRRYQNLGFIWMERSVDFMQHFLKNRDKYPTLDSFMPQVVNFVNYTAENFDRVLDEFNHRQPYIVDAFPLPGSTVSADVDTIKIRFSEPMFTAHSLHPIEDESISRLPIAKMPWWQDSYTYIIPLRKGALQKGKTYGTKLSKSFFQSQKTYGMKEDFEFIFKTIE